MPYKALCFIFGTFLLIFKAFGDPEPPSLGTQLDKLAPHAAGLALVEVTSIMEVDARPKCGNLYLEVRFRIIHSSGMTTNEIHVVKEYGGNRPSRAIPYQPHGPVKLDTFKQGQRYWVAFCSQYDYEQYPQWISNSWPENDSPDALEEAVRVDYYATGPQFHPELGLTHRYRVTHGKKSWSVYLERDGRLLWTAELPGEIKLDKNSYVDWRTIHLEHHPWGLVPAHDKSSGWYLCAETYHQLEVGNDYGLPAGDYRSEYALDADDGKTATIWISKIHLGPRASPWIIRHFDSQTGKVKTEERFEHVSTGGLQAGSNEERWYRQHVRTFDPATGVVKTQADFRFASTPEGSRFLPVNPQ
jgi:hypothetical protein